MRHHYRSGDEQRNKRREISLPSANDAKKVKVTTLENTLAKAGFKNVYNITDGMEGDKVEDPGSVFHGKRMRNGWKNSAPWTYSIDPEKIILEEGASKQTDPK